jgi:hypothetical protein
MATLADINHDSGPPLLDHWDSGSATRFTVTVSAALNSTVEGLESAYSASADNQLKKAFVASTDEVALSFYFDPNGAGTPTSDRTLLALGVSTDGSTNPKLADFIITKKKTSGDIEVSMEYGFDPSNTGGTGTPFTISDAPHLFEIHAKRATSSVSSDGFYKYYLDSVLKNSLTGIDNYDTFITMDSVFALFGRLESAMGTGTVLYLDEILLTDALPIVAFTGYDLVLGGGQP